MSTVTSPNSADEPTPERLDKLAEKAEAAFGYRPLLSSWHQLHKKHVFTIARTGFGKTLTFWLPLLARPNDILIVVTPLNILAKKNAKEVMEHLRINRVAVTAANADENTF
ncbi:hypothetical protein VKT23_001516 [Stygiomarasmius scandens]|uniref:DEAD/DEAH-box helicase domain-containing protein n=1 Tax=Marasmiellus scandens TaxID=2682957 RepID=A0ABR1K2W7_9AGAR